MSITEARAFVNAHHRHHRAPVSGLFAVGLSAPHGTRVGCAIVGRPVARMLQDGWTAEITRVCVLEGWKNGCSMLYGACRRAAKALGYTRLITYTLASEPGTSLRAAGYRLDGESRGGSWSRPSRAREDKAPLEPKLRWVA